ncbi:MAG: biotin-dependent carboxyltransferase family protein [Candidatus Pelagibacter sp.]
MTNNFFEAIRPGINSTFQDLGRKHLYHVGLPFSGAMDQRNYLISNSLVGNKKDEAVLEFAYQGPLLKVKNDNILFAITGNVNFKIKKKTSEVVDGECYKTYLLNKDDELDIISTNQSVYGYLAVSSGFKVEKFMGSYSTTTRAGFGGNNGTKILVNQKIYINNSKDILKNKKINFLNSKIEFIRILKGTNFDYFSENSIQEFFSKEFTVTKLTDRMGMRLKGPILNNNKETNIRSEGLIKGVIQVPTDGNPIIMLSDHGTIGGYPKIGVVISADYDKLVQLPPNAKIKFKLVELNEAEKLFKFYKMETDNLLNQIR